MGILKCKMCGGTIEFKQSATVGECEHCGTRQTLPKLDDDHKVNLYDRANHFRRNNDYDKAANIYEQILNEDSTDPETYWSLVLCQYGIEYVEDPATHKRVPTVNRAQFTSIFDDENYKSAIQYSDTLQRTIYEQEAYAINEIQKGILSISQKEDPFDVFICYKETDANGRRTQDSVLANDLYHQLVQEGFNVFFSRITLEDKLGTAYEPYIFAALNSAKVMVVLGTKPEYFNAVWVKNEWSRYLGLVKNSNGKKILIPAYKDMDPYDLPEEFSHLQAQDMSKLGFMQDLIRGIKKLVVTEEVKPIIKEIIKESPNSVSIEALLKRVKLFLEDNEWDEANTYCEKVLDIDPENAEAYLGKLMVECKASDVSDLENHSVPLDRYANYRKVIRFSDDSLRTALENYNTEIKERLELKRLTDLYDKAVNAMESSENADDFMTANTMFLRIPGFKDSDVLAQKCYEKAEECTKNDIYDLAIRHMSEHTISSYQLAINEFSSIISWRDSVERIKKCQKEVEEITALAEKKKIEEERKAREEAERVAQEKAFRKAEEERKRRKKKKIIIWVFSLVTLGILIAFLTVTIIVPLLKRSKAERLISEDRYEEAYNIYEELGDKEAITANKKERSLVLIKEEKYDEAYTILAEIGEDETILSNKYDRALELINSQNYEEAYNILNELNYKDSAEKKDLVKFEYNKTLMLKAELGSTVYLGKYEQDNNTTNGKEEIEWLVLAKEDNKVLLISKNILDFQQYNISNRETTWEDCSLRKWLNESFINEAFSLEEQDIISLSDVEAYNNPDYLTSPGNNTSDKIFILSIVEAKKLFGSNEERKCKATNYSSTKGVSDEDNNCNWWLRSPGYNSKMAAIVLDTGFVYSYGYNVGYTESFENFQRETYTMAGCSGIRPALWIRLDY